MLFLFLSGVMVFGITVVGMIESWRNLYEWGEAHHYGTYSLGVPVMVDFYILVGEMLLFVLIVDGRFGGFSWFTKAYLWTMFLFGLGLSLAGNIDHLRRVDLPSRIGFALPPLASAMGMAAILMVLKLIAEDYDARPADEPDGPGESTGAPVHGASILVPVTVHKDKVAHPVAHAGASGADGPKMVRPAVNGASRSPRVRSNPAMEHAAREYLARLRHEGQPLPKDRALAKSHFNPGGQGNGNRRAAKRILAEFTEAP
jgi:hypothetical protein